MTEEFVCVVGPGQKDYTTSALYEAACQSDYDADNLVFSHSGIIGAVDDGSTVIGQDSGASGTVVHATDTQILIETITGIFQDEQVYVTEDVNYVNIVGSGSDAHPVCEFATTGASLTTGTTFAGWVINHTTNYLTFRAAVGHEAELPINTSKFCFEHDNTNYYALLMQIDGRVDFENLQANIIRGGVIRTSADVQFTWNMDGCVFKGSPDGDVGAAPISYSLASSGSIIKVKNTAVYDWKAFFASSIIMGDPDCTVYIHNCTLKDNYFSLFPAGSIVTVSNCILNGINAEFGPGSLPDAGTHNVLGLTIASGTFGDTWSTGTTTSASTNKLISSSGTFISDGVQIGSIVKNTTDVTYTYITAIDSETTLSVNDDIFAASEDFEVYMNMSGVPTYRDESNDDFHLNSGDTAARNKGKYLYDDPNLPVLNDLDGKLRIAPYDVGADEFQQLLKRLFLCF